MTTTGSTAIEPRGYDLEGYPLYATDELDRRYDDIIDKLDGRLDIDAGITHLLREENAPHLRDFAALLCELVERELEREAAPKLGVEEGREFMRANVVDDLRAKSDEYERMRDRLGWPADPALLDEDQASDASMILLHPELLEDLASYQVGGPHP